MIRALRSFAASALAMLAASAATPSAASTPHPLFASSEVIHVAIRGPLGPIRRSAERSTDAHDAMLTLEGANAETHPIRLSARGITRRRRDICTFPPLRVEFVSEPPATSLFHRQDRLKLVTHCQPADSFQQLVLLEYAAYRLLNILSPISLRVRLARIDYAESGADPPFASRLGFFVEDIDDAARRNGMVEIDTGNVAVARLSAAGAARFAVFQYMIGNLDWAMNAGPPGTQCCHNAKLLSGGTTSRTNLVPVPYDFDHSGLVDAPYATTPPEVPLMSVRTRRYRGFCIHNAQAQAAAAQMLASRRELEAVLGGIPELNERTRNRASLYLGRFFGEIGSAGDVATNLLRTCLR